MSTPPRCINITPQGERRRRLSGWAALLAGAIVVAGLAWRGASPSAYLVVFPFALAAAIGFLQARNRTCVVLGLRGAAEVAGGGLRRVSGDEDAAARAQAKRILWRSIGIAAVVTLGAWIASGITITR